MENRTWGLQIAGQTIASFTSDIADCFTAGEAISRARPGQKVEIICTWHNPDGDNVCRSSFFIDGRFSSDL